MKITRFFFIAILPQINLFFAISAATFSNPINTFGQVLVNENITNQQTALNLQNLANDMLLRIKTNKQ